MEPGGNTSLLLARARASAYCFQLPRHKVLFHTKHAALKPEIPKPTSLKTTKSPPALHTRPVTKPKLKAVWRGQLLDAAVCPRMAGSPGKDAPDPPEAGMVMFRLLGFSV